LAVVLSSTPGSLSTNAWPARPRRALPRHIVDPATTPRIYCVPRIAAARARFIDDASLVSTGAALLIETGAHPEIAIKKSKHEPGPPPIAALLLQAFDPIGH
jgi:hypothetical protein